MNSFEKLADYELKEGIKSLYEGETSENDMISGLMVLL